VPFTFETGGVGLLGISTDITDMVTLKDKFKAQAQTDALTGIMSRRYLMETGAYEVKRSRRDGTDLAVIRFDIDRFKGINDKYGHAAGDLVIQACVGACQPLLREVDRFGRIGGDEFVVVLLPGVSLLDAQQIAQRMRAAVEQARVALDDGHQIAWSNSFGVAALKPEESLDTLLARADAALYQAKAQGRNTVALEEVRAELN
jgi:diguanylate cyclase (GGDEF)-like protein